MKVLSTVRETRPGTPNHTKPGLSLILPAFNEEENIASTLSRAEVYLGRVWPGHEIIVVDDGSRDSTAAIVQRMMDGNPRIRLIRHGRNLGYGAALRSGFAAARGEFIFFMDADGQFDITDLDKFFPFTGQYDGVVGYRLRRQDHFVRRLNAFGWNALIRILLGVRVRDIDCAFKLYHRRVLESITIESDGAMINAEMLAKITARGFRLKEVGVHHFPRRGGRSTGGNPRVIIRAFTELCALYRQLRNEQRLWLHGARQTTAGEKNTAAPKTHLARATETGTRPADAARAAAAVLRLRAGRTRT